MKLITSSRHHRRTCVPCNFAYQHRCSVRSYCALQNWPEWVAPSEERNIQVVTMLLWVLTFSLTLQVTFLRSAMTREGKIKCRSCQEEGGKYRIRNIKFSFLKTWLCLLLFCRCQLLESGGERWFEKNAGECKVRGTCQERHHLRRRRNGYPDTHHGPHLQGESSNYVNYRLSRPTLTLPTTHKSPRERFRNQTSFKVHKKHCYSIHQYYHYHINMVKCQPCEAC